MFRDDAKRIVSDMLAPVPYDSFFGRLVERQSFVHFDSGRNDRAGIIGPDPKSAILARFEDFSQSMTYHADSPTGPVSERRPARDARDFQTIVDAFHANAYTVRIHDVTGLSDTLDRFIRALEILLEVPVSVMVFWSPPGGRAPVHDDRSDILCVQLMGRKRWFISKSAPTLPNPWKFAGETLPQLGEHDTSEVGPGDLIYMPRGTPHTVQSLTESIHLSIGFTPVTLRDALEAMLDHMSDMNLPMRAGLLPRADALSDGSTDTLAQRLQHAVQALATCCGNDDFVETALQRRRARTIRNLAPLPQAEDSGSALSLESVVERAPLAISETIVTDERIDLSLPDETVLLHPGVEDSLNYMTREPSFRIADIEGDINDDVRIELARKLVAAGFLRIAGPTLN